MANRKSNTAKSQSPNEGAANEDTLSALGELIAQAKRVLAALQTAETCETQLDLDANIHEAMAEAKDLAKELLDLQNGES